VERSKGLDVKRWDQGVGDRSARPASTDELLILAHDKIGPASLADAAGMIGEVKGVWPNVSSFCTFSVGGQICKKKVEAGGDWPVS
jgi:hypothetical protein